MVQVTILEFSVCSHLWFNSFSTGIIFIHGLLLWWQRWIQGPLFFHFIHSRRRELSLFQPTLEMSVGIFGAYSDTWTNHWLATRQNKLTDNVWFINTWWVLIELPSISTSDPITREDARQIVQQVGHKNEFLNPFINWGLGLYTDNLFLPLILCMSKTKRLSDLSNDIELVSDRSGMKPISFDFSSVTFPLHSSDSF